MNQQDAIEWAKGSEYTAEVYHATAAANVDALLADGFDLGRAGSGYASIFGDAIYATQDAGETLAYYLSGDDMDAVAGRIRVTNPLRIEAYSWMHEEVLHNEIFEAIGDVGRDDIETVADLLAASEYDAIIIEQVDGFDRAVGGSQIILQSADQIALYPMPADVMATAMAAVYGA
jgi:hypothetical protein